MSKAAPQAELTQSSEPFLDRCASAAVKYLRMCLRIQPSSPENKRCMFLGQLIVVHQPGCKRAKRPAAHHWFDFGSFATVPAPVLSPLHRRGRFTSLGLMRKPELRSPRPPRSALWCADLQPQVFAHPFGDALQHPLGCPLTADINVAVVGTGRRPVRAASVRYPTCPGRCWPAVAKAARLEAPSVATTTLTITPALRYAPVAPVCPDSAFAIRFIRMS